MSAWHVMVVEGPESAVRTFVATFVAERRLGPEGVVFGADVDLAHESLTAQVRAVLADRHALLVPEEVAGPLEAALARPVSGASLRLAHRHTVGAATLRFSAEASTRAVATRVRAALAALPPDVRFREHAEHETERSDTTGVHYAFASRGTLAGEPGGVLAVRGKLAGIDALKLDALHLYPSG